MLFFIQIVTVMDLSATLTRYSASKTEHTVESNKIKLNERQTDVQCGQTPSVIYKKIKICCCALK